jgi:hypothetical protein
MTASTRRALALVAGVLAFVAPATASHSLWSTQASATFTVTVPAAPTPPPLTAPAGFRCTNIANNQVDLAWSTSDGALSYRIYLSGTTTPFFEVAASATSVSGVHRKTWDLGNHAPATLVVRAVSSTGSISPESTGVSVTFGPGATCSPRGTS